MELVTAETECERRKIHYWAQQGRIWSLKCHVCLHSLPTAHFAPFLRSSPVGFSIDILSVSSRHQAHAAKILDHVCVLLIFRCASAASPSLRIRCLSRMSPLPPVQLHVEIGLWICPWPFVMGLHTRRGGGGRGKGVCEGEGGRGGRKSKVEGKWALPPLAPSRSPPFFRSPSPPHPPSLSLETSPPPFFSLSFFFLFFSVLLFFFCFSVFPFFFFCFFLFFLG